MSKRILILACTLMLGGCALPVPLQIASWAIDGLLFVTTEKTMADHSVSLVAQRDCAMLRVVTEGAFCRDDVPATAVAVAELLPPIEVNPVIHDALEVADDEVMARAGESPRAYQIALLSGRAGDDTAVRLASLEMAAGEGSESVLRNSNWQEVLVEDVLSDETAIAAARWQAIIDAPSFFDYPMEPIGLESIPESTPELKPELMAERTVESTFGLAFDAPAAVADTFDVQRGDDRLYLGDTGHDPYLNDKDDVTILGGAGDDFLTGGSGGALNPAPTLAIARNLGRESHARRHRPPGRAGVRGRDPPGRGTRRRRVHDPQGPREGPGDRGRGS